MLAHMDKQPHPHGPQETPADGQRDRPRGEVIISGLDTGPRNEERHNLTPTEDHARFQPQLHPVGEPDNEDG